MNKIYIILICILSSCTNPMQKVVKSKTPIIKQILDKKSPYEVQIIYTEIDTSETGLEIFKDYKYQVDEKNYFYPANTVSLPMAFFAAEYLQKNDDLTLDIPYVLEGDSLKHSLSDDIKQIFAIAGSDASDRIYELLGRDYINKRFNETGLNTSKVFHRLNTPNADAINHKKFIFFPSYTEDIIEKTQGESSAMDKSKLKSIRKGEGYIDNEKLVNEPFDFSAKNKFPLEAQHNFMKRIIFPKVFKENERVNIDSSTRMRLLDLMKATPKDAGYNSDYHDSFAKYLMYGDTKDSIPSHINIYNHTGKDYGTITETAYVKDVRNNIHFFLSATILVNKNNIYDGEYEYDEIGIPFLAQLGREFYALALDRKKD